MKNLNEELKKLNEYNYSVSADFSKKVMRKIRKGHLVGSMKYVVSFASLAAVACFAVVLYTNPNLKGKFFKGNVESEDMFISEMNQNAIPNSSSKNDYMMNNAEIYQDITENIKDNQSDSILFEEETKGTNRVENTVIEDKFEMNGFTSETDKMGTSESYIPNAAAGSQKSKKEELIGRLEKAGFNVTETETGLQVKGNKEEKQKLEDLLKDENVKIEQIEKNKIEIRF